MTISRVLPSGWAYRSILTSSQINQIDTNATFALDIRADNPAVALSDVSFEGTLTVNTVPSSAISIGIQTQVADSSTNAIVISAQAPYASASTNKSTGNIVALFPSPVVGGNHGRFIIQDGGSDVLFLYSPDGTNCNVVNISGNITLESQSNNVNILAGGTISVNSSSGSSIIINSSSGTGIAIGQTPNQIDFLYSGSVIYSLSKIGVDGYGVDLNLPQTVGTGNPISITGQESTGAGGGGAFLIAGIGDVDDGGEAVITGGATLGNGTSGGIAQVLGGSGQGTNCNGGSVFLFGGAPTGSGFAGNVVIGMSHSVATRGNGAGVIQIGRATSNPIGAPGAGQGAILYTNGTHLYVWLEGAGSPVQLD